MIAIIPAKGHSRRIPGKNIREFFGKPIIAYSIKTAKAVCDRVIVSTDDDAVASIASSHGAEIHRRGYRHSDDSVGTHEIAALVLGNIRCAFNSKAAVVYPCAPLLLPDHIDEAGKAALLGGFAVAVGTEPLRDAGCLYVGHCADFLYRTPLWTDFSRLLCLPEERVQDINTEDDWKAAEEKYAALYGIKR